jgi:hypothetical protein
MARKKKSPETIFIQIASYRDPELVPTINSILENAAEPSKLRFGICRQFHPDDKFDDLSEWSDDPRFRIDEVPYQQAEGVCWARNRVQQLYKDETYTMQLDSHHRLAPNWDSEFIDMIKQLQQSGHEKPLLTGYVSSYDPENEPAGRVQDPWRMYFDRFIPEGAVFFIPETIPDWEDLVSPIPARFYSAHFCFTLGIFSTEVQHDPEYYFHGEEIAIAARAYTWGYDLFHPHKPLVWHEYTRKGRTKQWDDVTSWGDRNEKCHKKNRSLFGMDGQSYDDYDFGKYGFGTERTLREYEKFSGLLFSKRAVQQYTLDRKYPPNPQEEYKTEEEWIDSHLSIFKHCIDVGFTDVPHDDYTFWAVAFEDADGNEMFRQDADKDEIFRMKNDPDGYCKVWRQFNTTIKPYKWVVWPHSESKGWGERLTGNL